MLLSELNKVCPLLKQGFYVKWQGEITPNDYSGWYSYRTFAEKYDFEKIQVTKCDRHFYYNYNDFDLDLTLKKL